MGIAGKTDGDDNGIGTPARFKVKTPAQSVKIARFFYKQIIMKYEIQSL